MIPFQRSFTPVCEHESGEAGMTCETGRNSEPCKRNLGKRIFDGMKTLFAKQQASAAAACPSTADATTKCAYDSAGGEADALVLGAVLQTLRVLLSAPDVDLALCFIEDLVISGLSTAKVTCKREAYEKRLAEFVRCRSDEMSAAVAFDLLSITGPTQCGRRITSKGSARVAPASEQAALPFMQRQLSTLSASCSLGSAESVCTDGEQVPEERASERSRTKRATPMASSAASQDVRTGAPDDIVTEKTNPMRRRLKKDSSTCASSSEAISQEACPNSERRRPWRSSDVVHRSTAHRNSHNQERRSHDQDRGRHNVLDGSVVSRRGASQPAQGREGVSSWQSSAEQHPDFDHHLAAELQQYNVDRVLRLGRSVRGG